MRQQFSGSDEPFKAPNKKKEMKIEFRLLHDIVAKALSTKAGSFDQVTTERLDIIIAITAGLKVNWAQILFQVLLNMVKTPKRQSQGFAIQTYINRNSEIKPIGESSKKNEDTASNAEVEARIQVAPQNFDSEKSSETDLYLLVARRGKPKQVTESSDSESTISFPLKAFAKRRRTQKPQTQQISTDDGGNSQYDSIPTIPVEGEGTCAGENLYTGSEEHERANRDQDAQMSNVSQFENQGFEIQLDSINPNDKESDTHSGPGRQVEPNISYPKLRLVASIRFRDPDWATQLLPRFAPRDNGKKIMEVAVKLYPVAKHCQQVINYAWDNVSAQLNIFEECVHFSKEVHIKDISSLESLVKIEEHLLEWGETEEFSELFERRSLILYKPFELEVEKVYHEHLANFKLDAPSVNYDYFCIRCLHKELKNEPPAQKDGHQAVENEHQAHNEQEVNLPGSDRSLEKHSAAIVLFEDNPKTVTASEKNNCDHQHITKLETTMVRNYADSHQQLVDELASVKSQLAAMVESIKEFGDEKKGEGGQNRPGQELNRTEEGSSGGQNSLRGRGSSSRGGIGPSPSSDNPSDPSNRFRYTKCITAFIMSWIKNPLAAILDSNKFTGLNYQDWLRNLNIVLASEKLLYTIEKSPPKEAPADISPEELVTLQQCNKFTGLNYQDWLRNLNIVLASEKLLYTIEKSPPKEAPADISPEELVTLQQWRRA
ncbi:hypothetical protein F511_20434 [Dorcoceras hygrometricum]|uniref:Uncharacterized protein n=1 Tax=Dorcoceras hygrometricum TaxID=472368 RepID=A0A2Z7DDY5_9LAMI|nr:hypothetical protein F511_20434 [Dorcoceras hygrometricum]